MNLIGIMQGRLLPPIDGEIQAFPGEQWRDEFQLAQECSLDFIEWIFEEKGWEKNAIMSDPAEIVKISRLCGIQVITLIADFFMDCPLLRVSKPEIDSRMKVFADLLERAGQLGIKVLNVPFVAIPFPFAKDDHQYFNAKFYESINSCWLIRQDSLEINSFVDLIFNLFTEKKDYFNKKDNLEKICDENTWNNVNKKLLDLINEN